jgi:hypothetical protein
MKIWKRKIVKGARKKIKQGNRRKIIIIRKVRTKMT